MDKEIEINVEFRFNLGESGDFKRLASEVHEEVERKIVFEVMKRTHMNKCQLARFLGIESKTLGAKLKK